MIISRTPFRISFFGGGTDYPSWVQEHGGAVLGTSFDKYCYISCRTLPPFFEHRYRVSYSTIETVREIHQIEHPAVRAILDYQQFHQDSLEIHYNADLPAKSGVGSSSAFSVGLLNTLKAYRGEHASAADLASTAIHIEQNILREAVGSQDQILAAYGGFNRVDFYPDGSFHVTPIIANAERFKELHSHLLLFFTGFSRFSTVIAQSKIDNFKIKQAALHRIREMVDEGQGILQHKNRQMTEFGELLHEGWQLKRSLSDKVSTQAIDGIYDAARSAGMVGGKLLGAGGGGFMLCFAKPEDHAKIREKLHYLLEIPFNFDYKGTRIVLYQPDQLTGHVEKIQDVISVPG